MRNPYFSVILLIIMMYRFSVVAVYAQDTIPPATPDIHYITVSPQTGQTTICWQQIHEDDVLGYVVYRDQSNIWIALDSVFSSTDTVYQDITSRALFFPESYVVAAFDTSRNVSPLSAAHTTIFASGVFDSCKANISLAWSPYLGWDSVYNYRIMMKEDTAAYMQADSVSGNILADTIQQITAGRNYCFYLVAVHPEGYISASNEICLKTPMLQPPAYIFANGAVVNRNKEIELTFTPDTAGELMRFILFRKVSWTDPWDSVTTVQTTAGATIEITDLLDTITTPLYYALAAVNACGKTITWSNVTTVMFLTGTHVGFDNTVYWTPYRNFPEGTDRYEVYRQNDDLSWTMVGSVSRTDTTFTENVEPLQYTPGNKGIYCYYVVAVGANQAAYPNPLYAKSVTLCLSGQFSVFIPNAFTPDQDGINDLFAPVFSFSPASYQLVIRNRWGDILFETTDYLDVWDGTDLSGNPVTEGTYTYWLKALTPENKTLIRTGTITVIFPEKK